MTKTEITITVDKPLEAMMSTEDSTEEYAKSIKNGMVLVSPGIHPPDVDVEVVEKDDDTA